MRRLLATPTVLGLLAVSSTVVHAQSYAVDRGSILIDGQAAFRSQQLIVDGEPIGDRVTQLTLAPSALYFVVPGLAVGGELTFGYASAGDNSYRSWGVGPAVSYYFGRGRRSVHPYVGASAQVLKNSSDGATTYEETIRSYRGIAGLLFMLGDAVGVNAEVYYSNTGLDERDAEESAYGLALGISAFVF